MSESPTEYLIENAPETTAGAPVGTVVSELLMMLQALDIKSFFVLVTQLPSEAVQDPNGVWWVANGAAAERAVVLAVQHATPAPYLLIRTDGRYHFVWQHGLKQIDIARFA